MMELISKLMFIAFVSAYIGYITGLFSNYPYISKRDKMVFFLPIGYGVFWILAMRVYFM